MPRHLYIRIVWTDARQYGSYQAIHFKMRPLSNVSWIATLIRSLPVGTMPRSSPKTPAKASVAWAAFHCSHRPLCPV